MGDDIEIDSVEEPPVEPHCDCAMRLLRFLGLFAGTALVCCVMSVHLQRTPPLATWSAGRYRVRLAPAGGLPWWRLLTCEALSTWALLSGLPFYFLCFVCALGLIASSSWSLM